MGSRSQETRATVSPEGVSRYRRVALVAMVVIAMVAGAGIDRWFVSDSVIGSQRYEELGDLEEFEVLEQTYEYIRGMYVRSDDISDEELIWGAASGMMNALGDTGHSSFLNPSEAADLREQQQGSFVGIGIRIDAEVNPPRIIFPYEGSPAEEAGIQQNDVILAIDGTPYTEYRDGREFADLIGGDEGTDVVMELRHYGEAQSYTVTITRARVEINTVSWSMLPDNVMWLRLTAFDEGSSRDFQRALRRGKRLGAEYLILDLRGNPGGWVTEQMHIIGQFLEEGSLIVTEQDANGNTTERRTQEVDGMWRDLPVVVLIDGDSVSSSEVTAAALAENGRAITVGQTTFGTGTTVIYQDLSDGSILSIGILTWITPAGTEIWHVGLDPMIEVEMEPGVPVAIPYIVGPELDMGELLATNDDQLLVAFEEVLKLEGNQP